MQKTILDKNDPNRFSPTNEDIQNLSEMVRGYLTEKRYIHTISTADEAAQIGEIYLPDDVNRLRASALLHDITKAADYEKQLQYCKEFGIIIKSESTSAHTLHAMTAAGLAARDFCQYVDSDIISGIRWHTTGRYGMTVFESIIYLADYIEPNRKYSECKALRDYFYSQLQTVHDKYAVLRDAMIYSFDITIDKLLENKDIIAPDTIGARNYFILNESD